jgi:hypothetical protein
MNRQLLVADLQKLARQLVEDLHVRLGEDPASHAVVMGEFEAAKAAGRTSLGWEAFREDYLTQVAVAWVLSTVFVRFVEDNQLCDEPWLAGSGHRLQQARDRYSAWIQQHPRDTDREYLLHVFESLAKLPGLRALLGKDGHSYVYKIGPTADGARALREFWTRTEGSGLRHDFVDPSWDTRFLGDLYQDLSEHAQKKYALLQTPDFVEEFLLDRTLEPALAEFGLKETRLIDPSCGSGHFLLGAFARLFQRWQKQEPATAPHVLAQRALDAVAGVDLNPFAVAIARFRLLLAALKASGVKRLKDAFDFRSKVAVGDTLLHSVTFLGKTGVRQGDWTKQDELQHFYGSEDKELLREIFGLRYHAVVGNPPYILARDKALNALYRANFPDVCHRKYSLGVPFTQAFFELARFETAHERKSPGFVGMITANSFMKREFGSKLIEQYLNQRVELSHVLDLSGAYIPGHGTPTAILEGRPRTPTTQTIRAVLGIKGEPSTPDDPAKGLVWTAIVEQIDRPGSESDYVSCADVERERFANHPWSIGGGGASELKEQIEEHCEQVLSDVVASVGVMAVTGEDESYTRPRAADLRRIGIAESISRTFCEGDVIRDWSLQTESVCLFPYDEQWQPTTTPAIDRALWATRSRLQQGIYFGQTKEQRGMNWWEYGIVVKGALRTPLSIAFAFVATHNHFVLDRGGKVFNRSAPVIKLPSGATEDDHLGLLGLLNSSTACFWCQQVMHNKGGPGGGSSKDEKWHDFYEFAGTALGPIPIPDGRPLAIARQLDRAAARLHELGPRGVLDSGELSRPALDEAKAESARIRAEMIYLQEELDWFCLRLYGLVKDDLTYHGSDVHGIQVGERAFEVLMAKQVADGKLQTKWFEWLHATPITEVPRTWPKAYRDLVQRRVDLIQSNRDLALVEQMQSKRRWEAEPWEKGEQAALRSWLLDRMEDPKFWPEPRQLSTARFADLLHHDADFVQVANLYRGNDHYDFAALVRELVESESVPFLPVLRYKPTGLRKRAAWERTWDLQRREDAGEKVGPIDVPPKYVGGDFLKASWWSLRGKLDVPKERFISYLHAERGDDPSPVFTWAGFDHLQQAKALAAYVLERREQDGWGADKLIPLYAGLRELLPWLRQWHNDIDPESQQRLGDYFAGFLDEQLRGLGLTEKHLSEWAPPARGRGRGRKRVADESPDEVDE